MVYGEDVDCKPETKKEGIPPVRNGYPLFVLCVGFLRIFICRKPTYPVLFFQIFQHPIYAN